MYAWGANGVHDGDADVCGEQARTQCRRVDLTAERHHDGAHAHGGNECHHCLGALRHDDGDTIPLCNLHALQAVGQPLGGFRDAGIGPDLALAGLVFVIKGDVATFVCISRPAMHAGISDI